MKIGRILILVTALAVLLAITATALAQERTHIVQPGETLFGIARRYGLTVEQLAAANGITNPARIYAGQVLVIPSSTGTGTTTGTRAYTVQAGDTLFSIARRFNTTVDTLVRLNGLSNANVLFVGQVILVPGEGQPPPTTPSAQTTYTVRPGDTLFSIARRFNTTVDTLVRLNGLSNADVLYVGQVLIISTGGGQVQPTTAAPTTPSPTQPVTHVVQPGETLGHIALRYGTTTQQLALLNNLSNPDLIYAGQTLTIRPGSGAPTTPTATTPASTTAPATTSPPTTTPTTATPTPTTTLTTTVSPTTAVPTTAAPTTPPPTTPPTAAPGGASPTPIVPVVTIPANAPNLFANPSFEGQTRPVIFGEVNLFQSWEPFYCDEPYTPQKCPALRQGTGNPEGLLMGRPEYKATDLDNRVHSGNTAQQWFCFFRTCRAGVFQTVTTTPGAVCETGAYVQSWSANATGYVSDLLTQDQRANSTWFIRVDTTGGTNAFAEGVLVSRGFGYGDGIYDQYVLITYTFTATSSRATIFFENLRLWPIANNDNYIDDAYVRCAE